MLRGFFGTATADHRISKSHLALYLALYISWVNSRRDLPLVIFSKDIMPAAKISSTATYHTLMRDLHNFGYIQYLASFYKKKGSEVYLNLFPDAL